MQTFWFSEHPQGVENRTSLVTERLGELFERIGSNERYIVYSIRVPNT